MLGNIYSGCCCFTRYYPRPTYQELDDIEVKTNNQEEKDNLNKTAGADLDYRSTVISNPSSSSFEVEDSEENEEIAKLSTDLYNTNNLNNQFNENGSVASKKTSGQEKTRAPSAFTIQSDVSIQLSSWQSASFAMAQASVSTARRKKSSCSVGLDSVEGESASSFLSGESHLEEQNKKQGRVSPLGQLKEKFKIGSLGEKSSSRLGLYTSLTVKSKDNKQSSIPENSNISMKVDGDRSQKAEEVEERNPNQGEAIVPEDLEMTIVEEGCSTETASPGILKNPLISPVMQPIKTILGVFSSCDQAEPETPIETADSAVVEEPETVEEIGENEVSSESDPEESSSYSIATSDISTDPTSEDEGNGIQESFFPELYQTAVNFDEVTTAKRLSRQNSWVGRYPVLKPEEDSSSIATDELSETTNDLSSTHNEEETPRSGRLEDESEISESSMSDYERLSGRESDLEIESLEQELDEPEFNDETKFNQEQLGMTTEKDKLSKFEKKTKEEPVPEGYYSNSFVRYDPNTNEFVRYDDPELIETDGSMRAQRNSESIFQLESDSNFSFPGRTVADEGEKEEGDEEDDKEEEPVLELESPVPSSCMDGSTIVGSCGTGVTASSGGDTLLSVSRTGTRSEEGKKKGGIVSRFKRKMLKK